MLGMGAMVWDAYRMRGNRGVDSGFRDIWTKVKIGFVQYFVLFAVMEKL